LELNEEECLDAGGEWGLFYYGGTLQCNLPTSDAGKECTDSSQCEGNCEAKESAEIGSEDTGMCAENKLPYRCMMKIENGVVEPCPIT